MKRRTSYKARSISSPNWLDLPREVTMSIFAKLDTVDILKRVQSVCTQWESICNDPSLWKSIRIDSSDCSWVLDIYCKEAVNLSCGGLINLDLTNFASDELLDYVTQRCTQIRRLRLVKGHMSNDGLCEVAKRLPLLDDLEISNYREVTAKVLIKFGECCPLLKSLKINRLGQWYQLMDDSEAMAIAENMKDLCHLQLIGNKLTDKGLKAIVDSCNHLESLVIRQCFNINVDNSYLGRRCAERIKDFRVTYDSTNDYVFNETLCYDDDDDPLSSKDVDFWCDYGSD